MSARVFTGVNFNNMRKALFLMFFGTRNGECDDFNSPLYKYIIPMQGNFMNPLMPPHDSKDTYMMYWIDNDTSLTQDDYYLDRETNKAYNRQKCVATIFVRFIGRQAEDWVKSFRHLCKRDGVDAIWSGVCNAERLEQTSPIVPTRVYFSGENSEIAFDVRFKLYYDELIPTEWSPLEGIDFATKAEIIVDK